MGLGTSNPCFTPERDRGVASLTGSPQTGEHHGSSRASLSAGVPKFRSADVSRWGGTALLAAAVLALNLALAPGADDTTGNQHPPDARQAVCVRRLRGRQDLPGGRGRPDHVADARPAAARRLGPQQRQHPLLARQGRKGSHAGQEGRVGIHYGRGNEVHACQPLPEGRVMIAESGPMRIIEVDRQGKIARK